jgi:hypothetical protein
MPLGSQILVVFPGRAQGVIKAEAVEIWREKEPFAHLYGWLGLEDHFQDKENGWKK